MVPFVRVTRDKRGYEHIALMHASTRRGRPGRPRTLYVFRTPPGVKLGREPFDESIRRLLEEQNPGLHFDWAKLSHIAPPPPDVEYWRERRRAEKATRQARRDAEPEEAGPAQTTEAGDDAAIDAKSEAAEDAEVVADAGDPNGGVLAAEAQPQPQMPSAEGTGQLSTGQPSSGQPGQPDPHRRRRRRRGGRGRRRHRPESVGEAAATPAEPPKVADDPSKER